MNIAPKGFQPLEGTASRNQILGDTVAPKGQFAGAGRVTRRPWAMPYRGRGVRCSFETKPGRYCQAYHTKASAYCVGHERALANGGDPVAQVGVVEAVPAEETTES